MQLRGSPRYNGQTRPITFASLKLFVWFLEKYWKKYQYASKFVQLVKSKTPKVTLYTKHAKVMLMENSPSADLEVCFYDGEGNGRARDAVLKNRKTRLSARCPSNP